MKKDNRLPKDIIQVFGTMLEERLIPIGFKFFKSTKTLKLTLKGYDLSFSLLSDYNNRQAEWIYLNSCCFNVKHKDFSKWHSRYLSLDNFSVYNECFGHHWSLLYEEEQENTLKQELVKIKQEKKEKLNIGIVIGPEGGIDKEEIEILKQEVLEEIFEEKYLAEDKEFLDLINTYTSYREDDSLKEIILKTYRFIRE